MRTIYEKMTPKEIANMLDKSINATNKAIQKIVKINPSRNKRKPQPSV